ncbi:hypothetical protein FNV43_RR01332 [Rhamnella rubrinervis]|uniref:Glycosyltransferase n=1 Tax=Rhamnella rubrinervis TaxID=2594499 RepID=A0A8K0HR97_9ROSA|nr:hypothetical protein FNV43_RR01332 [Rhamnella rubrinervis]
MAKPRFLLVTYPAQGHLNPTLQFARRLIAIGADVTFVTTVFAYSRMGWGKASIPGGLSIATYSDGYDVGFKSGTDDLGHYLSEMRRRGSQALSDQIVSAENDGRPYTCMVYTVLLSWPPLVAHEFHLPSALLWIQPTTVFDIYYYYFNGYGDMMTENSISDDPLCSIELPGLPLQLTSRDLPSFVNASNTYSFAIPLLKEQFEILNEESNPKVLANTFDDLEPDAVTAIGGKFDVIGIGPLIPSAFLDGKDPSDTSYGVDLFQRSKDYKEWLNSNPKRSMIKRIRRRSKPSCTEELEKLGVIVPWCSQLEVLSHPSLGCFVTHCGWNSTLESLASGVPMVAFPQWTDQGTNAKLIEDLWKTGLRVKANKDGIVERDEIRRCLDLVMEEGEVGEEIRRNAMKWKDMSREAVKEGGSSDKNLMAFVDELVSK